MSKEMVEYHERRYVAALTHSLHLGVFHWAWEKRAMDHLKFARIWGEIQNG